MAYLEANGNICLNQEGVFLWIEANNPIAIKDKTTNRAFIKIGLKVVYQFLINQDWTYFTYRQIAEETNTGIGNVNI